MKTVVKKAKKNVCLTNINMLLLLNFHSGKIAPEKTKVYRTKKHFRLYFVLYFSTLLCVLTFLPKPLPLTGCSVLQWPPAGESRPGTMVHESRPRSLGLCLCVWYSLIYIMWSDNNCFKTICNAYRNNNKNNNEWFIFQ